MVWLYWLQNQTNCDENFYSTTLHIFEIFIQCHWLERLLILELVKSIKSKVGKLTIYLFLSLRAWFFWLDCTLPKNELLCPKNWGHRSQWNSAEMNNSHPWQLKKSKSWGSFGSNLLNSTANPAHLLQKWTRGWIGNAV